MKVNDYILKFAKIVEYHTKNNPDNVDAKTRCAASLLTIAFEMVIEMHDLAKARSIKNDSGFVGVVREIDNKYTAFLRKLEFDRHPYNKFFRSMILYCGVTDDGLPSEEGFKVFRDLNWKVDGYCDTNYWKLIHEILQLNKKKENVK